MSVYDDQLVVKTAHWAYPVFFSSLQQTLYQDKLPSLLSEQVVVITNPTVSALYWPQLASTLSILGIEPLLVELPDGETFKNQESLHAIYDTLLTHRIQRSATLIALGGGVIGDIAGFAAATYERGIAFIQIPTTLLAQIDASIGGKTAINHRLGKNMIGTFYQPKAVLIAQEPLHSLPKRELISGIAEVIKYALLGNSQFFDYLEANILALQALKSEVLAHVLYTCCTMKADIVMQDEKENSIRAILNLGHTFGHVIEQQTGYGCWLHGEAVAAGLCLAAKLSWYRGQLSETDYKRIKTLIKVAGLPVNPPSFSFARWMSTMQLDKKGQAGKLRFILLKGIGQAYIDNKVSEFELRWLLESSDVTC